MCVGIRSCIPLSAAISGSLFVTLSRSYCSEITRLSSNHGIFHYHPQTGDLSVVPVANGFLWSTLIPYQKLLHGLTPQELGHVVLSMIQDTWMFANVLCVSPLNISLLGCCRHVYLQYLQADTGVSREGFNLVIKLCWGGVQVYPGETHSLSIVNVTISLFGNWLWHELQELFY